MKHTFTHAMAMLLALAASVAAGACSTPLQNADSYDPRQPFGLQSPWVRRPSFEDARRITPAAVLATHELQQVALRCRVAAQGALENCQVDLESQPGIGLGEAALEAARLSSLKAELTNGAASEGHFVDITMVFDVGGPPDRTDHGIYPGLWGLYPSMPSPAKWAKDVYDLEDPVVR